MDNLKIEMKNLKIEITNMKIAMDNFKIEGDVDVDTNNDVDHPLELEDTGDDDAMED
uniref:Uncharacterized protein n=1 Tax=Solanum tuberosum TaxID=4113 RepID=M1DV98_SOLTU